VRYFANEQFHEELLTYEPVLRRAQRRDGAAPAVSEGSWSWTHGVIDLPNRDEHRFRWYEDNRYQILDPYTTLPNDPWYPRVRFNCDPVPPEWARMNFSPYRPYMVGTWVPGRLIDKDVIEFERKRIWWDGKKYPHVLVFDKEYNIKWALDGNPVEAPETQGYVYPWTRSRFLQCDPRNARVRVNVEIAPDDLIYGGFYFYEELDLIYSKLDMNPTALCSPVPPPVASSTRDDRLAHSSNRVASRDTVPSQPTTRAREPVEFAPVRLRRDGRASRMFGADRAEQDSAPAVVRMPSR
jgi:hypothetical protein